MRRLGNLVVEQRGNLVGCFSPMLLQFGELFHIYSTRIVVQEPQVGHALALAELDLSLGNLDFQTHFQLFAKTFGFNPERCVFSHQVHGKTVKVVTSDDIGSPFWVRKLRDVDGLITSEPGLYLVTTYADCMPVMFYDPVRRVVGVAHSGWRGTLLQIAREVILTMNTEFGTRPHELVVSVGPSIGPRSFEVGPDVAEEFLLNFGKSVVLERNGKLFVDLWKALELTLRDSGVEHVEFSHVDTCEARAYFYSYRCEKTPKRFAAVIGLRE